MRSKITIGLLFSCSLLVGFLGFFTARALWVRYQRSKIVFIPKHDHIILTPPQGSIQATVTNLSGMVKKEGRTDTDFKAVLKPTYLIEGESLATTVNGSATVTFNRIATLLLGKNTELDYLNSLPQALVIRQPNGTITYSTYPNIKPFSIRSLGLLTQMTNQAKVTLSTDTTAQTVSVQVTKGSVILAYSDQNNNTQVKLIRTGQTSLFDNNASTLTRE